MEKSLKDSLAAPGSRLVGSVENKEENIPWSSSKEAIPRR